LGQGGISENFPAYGAAMCRSRVGERNKIHLDSSLIQANASKDSIQKSCSELIAAYKQVVAAQETKLDDTSTPENYQAVNDTHVSTTDPDAALVSRKGKGSRPCYHHHRALDDRHGIITAVEPLRAASLKTTSSWTWLTNTSTTLKSR
jgi:hypothetical protein